ncbi:hypothetical protein FPZ24_09510 [Sphingomonas panacisoli]|uniref:Uncharacterized protein n=1 Tax=Sphingomonas panacisoli TaxID=1813879 RepID=A0A5B8LIN0_9SPHN|nr:hypothetical protein [Sphingomonas panacisoli]QDZ07699.1 hypothetical protein FPZ24_09510 [Sphingomonas panacisoli]
MWRYVKIPKAIALLAFLLPWMTVSCSNTKVAEANGWELVLGRIRPVMQAASEAPAHADKLNYYFVVAIGLIVIGLILSLMRKRMAAVVVATSLGALALIWAGAQQYTPQRLADAAKRGGEMNMDDVAASVIRVDWQIGYWVALGALAVAALLAFLAIRDPDTR